MAEHWYIEFAGSDLVVLFWFEAVRIEWCFVGLIGSATDVTSAGLET